MAKRWKVGLVPVSVIMIVLGVGSILLMGACVSGDQSESPLPTATVEATSLAKGTGTAAIPQRMTAAAFHDGISATLSITVATPGSETDGAHQVEVTVASEQKKVREVYLFLQLPPQVTHDPWIEALFGWFEYDGLDTPTQQTVALANRGYRLAPSSYATLHLVVVPVEGDSFALPTVEVRLRSVEGDVTMGSRWVVEEARLGETPDANPLLAAISRGYFPTGYEGWPHPTEAMIESYGQNFAGSTEPTAAGTEIGDRGQSEIHAYWVHPCGPEGRPGYGVKVEYGPPQGCPTDCTYGSVAGYVPPDRSGFVPVSGSQAPCQIQE
jgi:hypothetical protein